MFILFLFCYFYKCCHVYSEFSLSSPFLHAYRLSKSTLTHSPQRLPKNRGRDLIGKLLCFKVENRDSVLKTEEETLKMKSETLTLVLVNLAGIMERADESLLPGVYKEVGAALHTDPTGLGSLTLFRSIVQSSCYPLAAYLAVRHNRTHVIALGAFLWAAATFLVAISSTFFQVSLSLSVCVCVCDFIFLLFLSKTGCCDVLDMVELKMDGR
jgi:hypothetical protein